MLREIQIRQYRYNESNDNYEGVEMSNMIDEVLILTVNQMRINKFYGKKSLNP